MRTLVTAFLALVILTSAAQTIMAKTLRMSHMNPANSIESDLVEQVFIPYVEKNSDGRYTIDYYPGSALGNAETVVQGLLMGTIDLALDSSSNMDQFCPSLGVLDLPYLFQGKDIPKLKASAVGERLRKSGEPAGLHVIDMFSWFPRHLMSRVPLHTVEAIQGRKDRTTGNKWQMLGASALGLKPIPIPAAEMLSAIQQGIVDCMDINLPSMLSFHIVDVAKHMTLTEHAQVMGILLCSDEFWDDLSEADKQLFLNASAAYDAALVEAIRLKTDELVQSVRDAGVEVIILNDNETSKLKALAQKNLDAALSGQDKEIVRQIREIVR